MNEQVEIGAAVGNERGRFPCPFLVMAALYALSTLLFCRYFLGLQSAKT
jgi:hypothetical protein